MAFGSFATMAQYRLPRNKPWSSIPLMKGEKIHCPSCTHVLQFRDWCPVVGFIKNKGKCKFCAAPISPYYLFTEFGVTFFSVLNVLLYGFEQHYTPMTLFGSAAVVMVVTELKYQSIPEKLIVGMLFAALMHRMLLTQDINAILVSAVAGVMMTMLLAKLYQRIFHTPLPLEYCKLLALSGVALPLVQLPVFMVLVCGLAVVTLLITSTERVPYAIPIVLAELVLMYNSSFWVL